MRIWALPAGLLGMTGMTTVAELFYLRHTRTCAAVATGAQKISGKTCGKSGVYRGPLPPVWVDTCLSLAYWIAQLSVELVMQALLGMLHPTLTAPSVVALGLYG